MVTNANTESIVFSGVGVFALGYTAMKLKIQEHLMEKGLPQCHLGHAFILAFRINYKLEETREIL